MREDVLFPSQIHDIAKAMTIINNNAEEWFVDTSKIALCGFSTGGHNVLNYGTYYNKPVITDLFDINKVKPTLIIAGYPITEYLYMKEYTTNQDEMAKTLFRMSNLALFGVENPTNEERYKMSPSLNLDSSMPPTFLWATANDNLVPIGHTTRMATALADNNIPFEVHIYENGQHGLSLATQATASSKVEVDSVASEWINSVDK